MGYLDIIYYLSATKTVTTEGGSPFIMGSVFDVNFILISIFYKINKSQKKKNFFFGK